MWQSTFQKLNVNVLLALAGGVLGVNVMPLSVFEPLRAGAGIFVLGKILQRKTLWPYNDSLVHKNLSKQRLSIKNYGEDTMAD